LEFRRVLFRSPRCEPGKVWWHEPSQALQEVGWIWFYQDLVEADMSAFHRVDDIYSMDADKFFGFAKCLIHYSGAVRGEAESEQREKEEANPPRKVEPVKDSNQRFLERQTAKSAEKDSAQQNQDPSIDP